MAGQSAISAIQSPAGQLAGAPLPDEWFYPVGRFPPMSSQEHLRALILLYQILLRFLPEEHYVGSELLVLYDPLNLRKHLMPDVFVSLHVGQEDPLFGGPRKQYRIWDEGKGPDIVVEAASDSTVARDNESKKEGYARRGVREYVQFDPLGTLLEPHLQVFRLTGPEDNAAGGMGDERAYEPAPVEADGAVWSVVLPCAWVMEGNRLRLRERATGLLLPTPEEAALAERDILARRAATAEEELARLREELARLKADRGEQR